MKVRAEFAGLLLLSLLVVPLFATCNQPSSAVQQLPPVSTAFKITGLSITPAVANIGEKVTIKAEVSNVGGIEGSYTVELMVNDTLESKETVVVGVGDAKLVSFSLTPHSPGSYLIRVDGLSGELVVEEEIVSGRGEKLGESNYEVEERIVFKNEGPGTVTRILLRLALITTREPYQKVEQVTVVPDNYTETEDENGNAVAEFELGSIEPGGERAVVLTCRISVNKLDYPLSPCEGTMLTRFLDPEPCIECNNEEIISLSTELGGDKLNTCEKSRAFYDWVGDNISYTGYSSDDRGALFALNNRGGDCSEFSYLMIALCRAADIPARLIEGITYRSAATGPSAEKHSWMEFYSPGIGWVPADPTWGRFELKRDAYFGRMSSDHVIVAVGNPQLMNKLHSSFHYYEYLYRGYNQKATLSHESSWQMRRMEN
jgi:transglutaminase-like putative cysteine protease